MSAAAEHRFVQLTDQAERMVLFQFAASCSEYAEPIAIRPPTGQRDQRALTGPGCTLEHDDGALSRARRFQGRVQRLELPFSIEQW